MNGWNQCNELSVWKAVYKNEIINGCRQYTASCLCCKQDIEDALAMQ